MLTAFQIKILSILPVDIYIAIIVFIMVTPMHQLVHLTDHAWLPAS